MKHLILIITFLTLAISQFAQGQQLMHMGDHFIHGKEYVLKKDIRDILQTTPAALDLYNESMNQYTIAKLLGIGSIAGLTVGLVRMALFAPFAVLSGGDDDFEDTGTILFLAGCAAGTIGIITKKSAKQNFYNSINLYNMDNGEYGKAEYKIELSASGNGLGLTYSF